MRKCRVLVTGLAAPGFISIAKALKASKVYDFEIVGTDYRTDIASSFYADKTYVLPDNRSDAFPNALVDVCDDEELDVLLPIRTDDQLPICRSLEYFRDVGTEPAIVVTDPDLLDTLLNKRRLFEYCKNVVDLDIPSFSKVSNSSELESAVLNMGYPQRPVVIKPSYSNGSRGFRILDASIDKKRLFFDEKPTGIYSTLDGTLEAVGEEFPELLVMEYLPGKEYTVDVLCRKGLSFIIAPRLRTRMTGGITTSGVLARDENYDRIKELSSMIVEGFGLSYNVGIQVKEDTSGVVQLLEINPRLQGTTAMTVAGGANIPELMVQMALNEFDYDYKPQLSWGLKMQRVWLEVFNYEGRVWQND